MLVDDLVLSKSLGKGSFGEVFLTKKVRGTELYATKRMDRAEYSKPENNKRLINEISILQKIKHPNIVRLIEVKKTKSHIYIVTEFCNGGSLSENLNKYIKANKKCLVNRYQAFIREGQQQATGWFPSVSRSWERDGNNRLPARWRHSRRCRRTLPAG